MEKIFIISIINKYLDEIGIFTFSERNVVFMTRIIDILYNILEDEKYKKLYSFNN